MNQYGPRHCSEKIEKFQPLERRVLSENYFCGKKTRLSLLSLVFFIFTGCVEIKNDKSAVAIQWKDGRATGLLISRSMFPDLSDNSIDTIGQLLEVKLASAGSPMLGEYELSKHAVVFRPLIPFTRGLKYQLFWKDKFVTEIEIPKDTTVKNPAVISIYPSADTLPENLLKIYIEFSKPMQEGNALHNLAVIRNGKDTLSSVFLDLESELWNNERTILTIWLDPGRIKRDLQPNQKMGSPLQKGNRYQILVKAGWADSEGATLSSAFRKDFVAMRRDELSPAPGRWSIHAPKAGTREPLLIELQEPLDYMLLKNAVHVVDENGEDVAGVIATAQKESALRFTPAVAWVLGEYSIEIEPRLEDLAGNNLERLFDRDLFKDSTNKKTEVYKIKFEVR